MIQAVIFDVGGVLIRTQDHSGRRLWESKLELAPWGSDKVVFNSEMGQKAQRGEITDAELWQWIGEELQLGDALEAFRTAFWSGDVVDRPLVGFIRGLRPAYQTAIISNATDGLRRGLREHGIDDAFDLIVGSAEERVMKPDPLIFERTLARLGRAPQEAVFVDDFAHNVQAARDLGMVAIHFQPDTDIPAAFADLGITAVEGTA